MNNCVKNTVCYLTNIYKYSNYFGKDCIFALQKGGLAHLARARHWQCRGDRFESGNLHLIQKKGCLQKRQPIFCGI